MEIRKDMPEELKNQMVDGKKRVIVEKIPEKLARKIEESLRKKQTLLNKFLKISINVLNAQESQREIVKSLNSLKDSISYNINNAFKKMKLAKRKNYNWQFKRDSFVGIYNPPKPIKLNPAPANSKHGIIKPTLPPKTSVRPSDR